MEMAWLAAAAKIEAKKRPSDKHSCLSERCESHATIGRKRSDEWIARKTIDTDCYIFFSVV